MKVGKMSNRKILRQVVVLCLCVAAGWFLKTKLSPHAMTAPAGAGGDPFVLVEEAQLKDVTPAQKFIGHVEAVNEVNIQPQVSGYLEKVLFDEGSAVKKGDILFVIEQQKYIATVDLRKAELDKAKASFTQLEKEYKRQKSLNQQKFASESKLDEAYSNMLQAQAAVKQAEANYELAKIDLEHTEIRSPINGYIGKAMITVGNYVSTSSGTLANIVQTDPVRIVFSVTDKEMLNLRQDYDKRGGEVIQQNHPRQRQGHQKADSFPFQRQLDQHRYRHYVGLFRIRKQGRHADPRRLCRHHDRFRPREKRGCHFSGGVGAGRTRKLCYDR